MFTKNLLSIILLCVISFTIYPDEITVTVDCKFPVTFKNNTPYTIKLSNFCLIEGNEREPLVLMPGQEDCVMGMKTCKATTCQKAIAYNVSTGSALLSGIPIQMITFYTSTHTKLSM